MAVKEIFMFSLNVIILMLGGLLIVFGVFITMSEVKQLITAIPAFFHIIGTLLIVLGSILALLSLIGCCGAMINNKYVINTYFTIMSIILLLEVAVVIAFYVLQRRRQNEAIEEIKLSMQIYNEDSIASQWDFIQNTSKCCGIDGPSDWVTYGNLRGSRVPGSCCEINRSNCTIQSAYKMGCRRVLGYFTQREYQLTGVIVGVLFLTEILGIIIAYRLIVNPSRAKWDRPL